MIIKMTAIAIVFFLSVTSGLGKQGSAETSIFSSFNGFIFNETFSFKILNITSAPKPSSIPLNEIANLPFATNAFKS